MAINAVGEIGNLVAYGYAEATVVTPIGVLPISVSITPIFVCQPNCASYRLSCEATVTYMFVYTYVYTYVCAYVYISIHVYM